MFDIGWSELLLTGIVALIVIGPKELPSVLRGIGASVGKLRRMAGEFQSQFNEALREAELDGLKNDIASIKDTASSLTNSISSPMQTLGDELKSSIENKTPGATPAPADMPTVDQMFTPEAPAPLDLSNPPDPGAVEPPVVVAEAPAPDAQPVDKPKRTRKKKAASE